MSLDQYIKERQASKRPLVMTHVVCGYPSFEANMQALEIMASFGVDFVELQFPFSEPSADGPLFVQANQASLDQGTTVDQCFEFMQKVSERFDFKVLMMGYYNTVYAMGHDTFLDRLEDAGGCGYILPDLPIEEGRSMHEAAISRGLAPILLMTPTNSDKRLEALSEQAAGFVYAVARKGVTGSKTEMNQEVSTFLDRCREHTQLPIGVGFGVSEKADVDFIAEHGDIAIIGTAALKAWQAGEAQALTEFFQNLGL